jgi:hypothetical protein
MGALKIRLIDDTLRSIISEANILMNFVIFCWVKISQGLKSFYNIMESYYNNT